MAIGIRQLKHHNTTGGTTAVLDAPCVAGNLIVILAYTLGGQDWTDADLQQDAAGATWWQKRDNCDEVTHGFGVAYKCATGGEDTFEIHDPSSSGTQFLVIEMDGAFGLADFHYSHAAVCVNQDFNPGFTYTPTAGREARLFGWISEFNFNGGGITFTQDQGTIVTSWGQGSAREGHYLASTYAASTTGSYPFSANATAGDSRTAPVYIGFAVVSEGGTGVVGCAGPPGPPVDVAVCALAPDGSPIACVEVPDATWAFRHELRGTGQVELWINRNSVYATEAILGDGITDQRVIRITVPEIDPDTIVAGFLETGDFTLLSSDEEGGELLHFAGRGLLSYWERAIWLSERFLVDWWPASCATPPATARGVVTVKAGGGMQAGGKYRLYTVNASDEITGYSLITVSADACWAFNRRQTYVWPNANPDGSDSKRFLVKLLTGPHTGGYFAPHQQGVVEYLRNINYGEPAQLGEIGDGDKPGQVLRHMYDEATDPDRPVAPISLMTVDFTGSVDSDGNAWSTSDALPAIPITVDETYLDTIGKLLGTGVIEMQMGPDFDMHAYNDYGRDLTGLAVGPGVVRFEAGINIAEQLTRSARNAPIATFAEVQGTEGAYAQALLPDASSRVPREIGVRGDTSDPVALEALGLAALTERLRQALSLTINLATRRIGDLPGTADEGYYLPGPPGSANGDFWVGDTVTIHTGSGEHDITDEDIRVVAITLTREENAELACTVELHSSGGDVAISTAPTLPPLASSGGGSAPPVGGSEEDLEAIGDHLTEATDAHDASAISVVDVGGFYVGTDVESVLAEIAGAAASTLDDLDDVSISSPETADRLRYDGALWVDSGLAYMPLTTVVGGVPELVWDADDSLVPTEVPT